MQKDEQQWRELGLGHAAAGPPVQPGGQPGLRIPDHATGQERGGSERGAEWLQDEKDHGLQQGPRADVIHVDASLQTAEQPDGEDSLEGVGRGDAQAGPDREIAAQNEKLMTDENAGPHAGPEAQSEGKSKGLGNEKGGGDEHMVDVEKETDPAGDGPGDREDQRGPSASAEPGIFLPGSHRQLVTAPARACRMRRGVLRNHKRCFLRQGLNGRGRCLSPRHGDHGEDGCFPQRSLCLGESARFGNQCHFTKRMLRQHRGPSRQGTRSGGAALGGSGVYSSDSRSAMSCGLPVAFLLAHSESRSRKGSVSSPRER